MEKNLLFNKAFAEVSVKTDNPFEIIFSQTISGEIIHKDIRKLNHILIGGTTGLGKSVFLE